MCDIDQCDHESSFVRGHQWSKTYLKCFCILGSRSISHWSLVSSGYDAQALSQSQQLLRFLFILFIRLTVKGCRVCRALGPTACSCSRMLSEKHV